MPLRSVIFSHFHFSFLPNPVAFTKIIPNDSWSMKSGDNDCQFLHSKLSFDNTQCICSLNVSNGPLNLRQGRLSVIEGSLDDVSCASRHISECKSVPP